MKEIFELSQTEGEARMVFLNAAPVIPPAGDYQRRAAREVKLSAAAPAARPAAAQATSNGPKDLAEAISAEIAAGNYENPGAVAARKYPALARRWAAELEAERV